MKYYIAVLAVLAIVVAAREVAGIVAERDKENEDRKHEKDKKDS